MSTITFPTTLEAARLSWGQQRRDLVYSSAFGSQAVENSPALWVVSLAPPPLMDANAGPWQALMLLLKGKTNALALWNLARPAPLGTMRGTMTLVGAHAQGATTLAIRGGAAASTLKQGDMLGVGSGTTQQVVMVTADATANGSGVISVNTEPPLRNAFADWAAVTWDKPCALFRVTQSKASWDYTPGVIVSGFALDLIEDWRA